MLTRKRRSSYRIIEQLQVSQAQDGSSSVSSMGVASDNGFRALVLDEAVKLVQEKLRSLEGTLKEQTEHQERIHQAGLGNPVAQEQVKAMIHKIIGDHRIHAYGDPLLDHMSVGDAVFALSIGAGYIENLYRAPDVEEVQVNDTDIYVMRDGIAALHPLAFSSTEQVVRLQERLALYGRARINEQHPVCHTYMFNRARLTMTQPNYSAFPTITIRNFIIRDPSLEQLMERGTLNRDMADLLTLLVKYHVSIVVAGGTKTGKTTTLYALAKEVPLKERILTLETEFEMMLHERLPGKRNIVPFQAVDELNITMEEAFKPLLRNSPDRIIIGEIRGAEASQAVQAALRGHDTMVSLHSKYRSMIVADIMDMVKQDGRSHDEALLKHRIARAFNIVAFQRFVKVNESANRRVISEISEIRPLDNGDIEVVPLILWNSRNRRWERTGQPLSGELCEHMISSGASEGELAQWAEALAT